MRPVAVPLPASFRHPIAHRGLHDARAGRIENTEPAFAAAIAHGYGIECDLRPAGGGCPVVFHDLGLDRLVDGTGPIAGLTAGDLAALRYRGQDTAILTFEGLLGLVGGTVPLLVEVKSEWDPPGAAFLGAIASAATGYHGPLALMSFDPAVVAMLAGLAPAVPRGLVSGSYGTTGGHWWQNRLSSDRADSLRSMSGFDAVGASFCAYEVAALPGPAPARVRARGLPVLTWTVRSPAQWHAASNSADAMIFEGFLPPLAS